MTTEMLNYICIGFMIGMAVMVVLRIISSAFDALQDWIRANRRINTDLPEVQGSVRALESKVRFLETDVKRLERFGLRQPLLDELEATTSADAPGDAVSQEATSAGA